jgi:hypothetical protein
MQQQQPPLTGIQVPTHMPPFQQLSPLLQHWQQPQQLKQPQLPPLMRTPDAIRFPTHMPWPFQVLTPALILQIRPPHIPLAC